MSHPDPFLETIREAERQKLNSFMRSLTPLRLRTTAEVAKGKADISGLLYKEFKPSLFQMFFLFIFVAIFVAAAAFNLFNLPSNRQYLTIILLVGGIQLAIGLVVFYFMRSKSYTIRIDHTGIIAAEKSYRWEDIYDTAILVRGNGKNERRYFIIAYSDMQNYDRYELQNFLSFTWGGFSKTLSLYTEAFKPLGSSTRLHQ